MKHMELHILQSVPVACLNRDDLNSPKTAIFGGVQRARVSSQSWKRAIREEAKKMDNNLFKGNRSRRMVRELTNRLMQKDIIKEIAVIIAEQVAGIIETLDTKKDSEGYNKIKTLMFFSEAEYDAIANTVTEDIKTAAEKVKTSSDSVLKQKKSLEETKKKNDETNQTAAEKELKMLEEELGKNKKALSKAFGAKPIKEAIKSVQLKDAADIALFGRMVASDHSLTVEAAAMFSHALSTHKVDNEIDFFSAVDDLQSKEESGAGMTSTLEFNSATYYRFAALNLDMLSDQEHLANMSQEERKSVVRTFLEATIKAMPGARKNTMNGNTLPVYVLGVVREKGHPIQLVNAFENPVRPSQGYVATSIELLKSEFKKLNETWGIKSIYEEALPVINIKDFLDGMVKHVI
jgi:CRISPR system Cascade subunit CasC